MNRGPEMLAVAIVRDGALPAGADECCAEADGSVLLVGTGAAEAVTAVTSAHTIWTIESDVELPSIATLVREMADRVAADVLVVPASPDGRDLAPLIAHARGVPLFAPCVEVRRDRVTLVRTEGRTAEVHEPNGAFVATLLPGVRGVAVHERRAPAMVTAIEPARSTAQASGVTALGVLPPDPATADLTEADRIVAGGQGLGSAGRFELLGRIASALGASLGGTRVASDAGWIPFERQIGTTGVTVDPSLYLAFGISGATQHTTGLGDPRHIVSVNTDASCPMMTMAGLAIVSDARAVLDELARRLGIGVDERPQ